MKVVAFCGSARKGGNTSILLNTALGELAGMGIETELVELAGKKLRGCMACYKCAEKKDGHCTVKNDVLNECLDKMVAADGILIGSPTYFADLSTETKALIDRAGFVARQNGDLLKRKAGAAVVAVRRAGSIHAFDSINHFFTISQMIIPGSSYWNIGLGGAPGEVSKDEEGIGIMKTLGQNMGWLLEKLNA